MSTSKPTFLDMTVAEHLSYIKSLQDTFETQYIMVQRLKDHVRKEIEGLRSDAILASNAICEGFGYTYNVLRQAMIDQSRRYCISRDIEELFLCLKPLLTIHQDLLTGSHIKKQLESLYPLVENYRKNQLCVNKNIPEDPIAAIIHKPELSLYPRDHFSQELDKITKLVDNLKKVFAENNQIFSLLNNYDSYLERYKKNDPEELPYPVQIELMSIVKKPEHKKLYDKYYEKLVNFDNHNSNLQAFLEDLEHETNYLERLASIYVDNILDSMKINWNGTQSDAYRIMKFLIDEDYISTKLPLKIFLADHFLYKGKSKTSDSTNSFPITGGKSYLNDHKLVIPLKSQK